MPLFLCCPHDIPFPSIPLPIQFKHISVAVGWKLGDVAAGALVRLLFPLAAISAFMNNTPVVAIMIPIVRAWCRQANLPPGHLFIPVSYTTILGGTVTLIGTSTNLVVAGKQAVNFPDQAPLHIFDLTRYGLPVALVGIIYIILFAPAVLPGHALTKCASLLAHFAPLQNCCMHRDRQSCNILCHSCLHSKWF